MSEPIWVWIIAFAVAAIIVWSLFRLVGAVAKWLLFPGPKPEHESEPGTLGYQFEEFSRAFHDLQVAASNEYRPRIERLAQWLTDRFGR